MSGPLSSVQILFKKMDLEPKPIRLTKSGFWKPAGIGLIMALKTLKLLIL